MSYYEVDYRRPHSPDYHELVSTHWLIHALIVYAIAVLSRRDTTVRLMRPC